MNQQQHHQQQQAIGNIVQQQQQQQQSIPTQQQAQFMTNVHSSGSGAATGSSGPFFITTTAETEDLKRFLATAPQMWTKPDDAPIRSYTLSNGESISCIFWKGKFFITGTDIVKILIFRFAQAGRPVLNAKKFEEGIFSDLRNLKAGSEAVLEEPKSEFLDFLFRHGCIRTQKKQKVFFWNCVPHESLFLDAIERDFKREGSLYHMNMMMNHTRYLQKQVAMMQASALQQQMLPPAPQMMPNSSNSRSNSFSTPFMTVSAAAQNSADPFLLSGTANTASSSSSSGVPFRLPNGKINLNAPIIVNPTPMKAPISRLSSNSSIINSNDLYPPPPSNLYHSHPHSHSLQQQQQHQQHHQRIFDYSNDFDHDANNLNINSAEDALLSDYLNNNSDSSSNPASSQFIDPSTILSLHEY